MIGRPRTAAWLFAVVLAAVCADARAQVVEITAATLDAHRPLVKGWRFHAGDESAWADPAFDDNAWARVDPRLPDGAVPADWQGIGWFRLHLRLAAGVDDTVAFELDQEGASEVYLDGRLLAAQGTVGAARESERAYWFPDPPRALPLERAAESSRTFSRAGGVGPRSVAEGGGARGGTGRSHLLAVRYSNQAGHRKIGMRGFRLSLHRLEEAQDRRRATTLRKTKEAMFLSGAGAAFTVLHLMLFVYFPRARANLFYALFAACVAGVYWSDQRAMFSHDPTVVIAWFKLTTTCGTLLPIAAVLVALSAFRSRIPPYFYLLAAAAGGLIVWCWLLPGWIDAVPFYAFSAIPYLETLRILGVAIYRRQSRAWVIGLGFALFVSTAFSPAFGLQVDIRRAFSAGLLMLLISVSVYLAMGVAQTERDLEARLAEVERLSAENLEQEREKQRIETERQLLEADNRRKTEELEAARQLQLSMLPAEPPDHPHVDVAFRMWTATEVGGDYYDYRVDGEGVLTLAIGDATGHGLDAGLVVVAAKSVFQTTRPSRPPDGDGLPALLERVSRGIRGLRLKRMNMAMTVIRVNGRDLQLAAAGMPPALLYRAAANKIEELLTPGPPLGTLEGFAYRQIGLSLEPGDGLLLMSDGLPELENADGELLGYKRARRLYECVATDPPARVVERIHQATRDFTGDRKREDDMTLVALRAR